MVSIITPLHKTANDYIKEAYNSLLVQTDQDFEWIIVLNNGGKLPPYILEDQRVKVFHSNETKIGALKKFACSKVSTDIIIELDADDMLTEEAIAKIRAAFANDETKFVYSEAIEFNPDWSSNTYGADWGWTKTEWHWHDRDFEYNPAFEVSPTTIRQIFWAPNHVRAWRSEAYNEIGGHDESLAVGDDHELIMRFYINYGSKGFCHIPEPLYLYRLHADNTFTAKAEEIAQQSMRNYEKHHEKTILRWARDEDLLRLDLGGRLASPPEYDSVDLFDATYICNLNKKWSFDDNSVGVLRAADFIEHMKDPIHLMNEAWRVLAPGGWFLISVPSADGRGAFQDPTHVSFWNDNSFWYYTNEQYAKYVPKFKGKFQLSRCATYFPTEWHKEHNISYVNAELIAHKPGKRQPGELLWQF